MLCIHLNSQRANIYIHNSNIFTLYSCACIHIQKPFTKDYYDKKNCLADVKNLFNEINHAWTIDFRIMMMMTILPFHFTSVAGMAVSTLNVQQFGEWFYVDVTCVFFFFAKCN